MESNYLPFFRKYRPQSFRDVVGQENLVRALSNAIELGRIANAYLFCGPRGTGKTSSARILAKSLNCVNGPTLDPCQKCPSCLDITNTSGLDVIEIDAATNRGIADAKELISQVQYAPMNGKYKIFIIDEVHMLSTEAFNALLKTFEEPPPNVIFILATTEPHKVIETIVSRCQRFDFRRISTDDITKKLREIADLEKIKITDDALFTIAKNVSGGLRDSLALLDQVSILGVKQEISKELIEEMLGKITPDSLSALLTNILEKNLDGALQKIEDLYSKGNEPRNICENLVEFLKNVIFILGTSQLDTVVMRFTTFCAADAEKIRSTFKGQKDNLIYILNKVIGFYRDIKNATNPYLWAELMIIELCGPQVKDVQITQPTQTTPAKQPETKAAPVEAKTVKEIPETVQTLAEEKIQTEEVQEDIMPVDTSKEIEIEVTAIDTVEEMREPIVSKDETMSEIQVSPEEELPQTPLQQITQAEEIQEEVKEEASPEKPVEIHPETDPQEIWSKIVNSIESVPAKFFFSGMAKLVDIKEDTITIGFLNQNTLNAAKADSKMKPFETALKNVFEKTVHTHFIQISKDAPAVEAKVQQTKKSVIPQPEEIRPLEDIVEEQSSVATQAPPIEETELETEATVISKPTDVVKAAYSQKTKEMIDNFNGKIID